MSRPTGSDDTSATVHVTGHAFEPRGAWWTTCRHCSLAEAAHQATTVADEDRR
jgi:hypothetical protein